MLRVPLRLMISRRMEKLNLSNIPIVTFTKIQGPEVQVRKSRFPFWENTYQIETIIYLDQSPLPSPRTTKTEATNGDSAARTSVSVSNNLRFTSKYPRSYNPLYFPAVGWSNTLIYRDEDNV